MILLSFILVNICIGSLVILYCKLTVGINKCSKHLVGKVVIVTGGNNGIGYETAKDLADRGAKVIIASRNEEKGTAARNAIVAYTGNKDVHFKKLDLASFKSVREFCDDILKSEKRLDILINNAGMHGIEKKQSEDGLLLEMQTNHFGPFLLTSLLLPLLKTSAPSRIINVSSVAHSFAEIDFDNLNGEKWYNARKSYGVTKLCNVLMTSELAKRLNGMGVTVNALHPGVVDTDIFNSISWVAFIMPLLRLTMKSPWEGAQTTNYLAVSPEVNDVSGKYFVDCREKRLLDKCRDAEVIRKLWEVSEKVVR